jgi:hypothetical protein
MIIKSTLGFSRCPISTAKRVHPHPGWLVSALVAGLSIAGLIGGCGDSDLPPGLTKKTVSIDEVPGKLRAAAKKAIPNVEFKEAWQSLDGQGKRQQASDGKIREVRVSLAGEILESE